MLRVKRKFQFLEAHVADSQLMSIIGGINPAGPGPDAPLFTTAEMAKLAAVPSSEQTLLQLVREPPNETTRFIAAEALVEGNWSGWRNDAANRRAVANALTNAMANDRSHNRWGLPGSFVGPFGKCLLSLGTEAQVELAAMLSDSRPLNIEGSEAATLNSQGKFRVSDLAAWLIASARQIPWKPALSLSERDAQIGELRNHI
jgi:hypothetical protein